MPPEAVSGMGKAARHEQLLPSALLSIDLGVLACCWLARVYVLAAQACVSPGWAFCHLLAQQIGNRHLMIICTCIYYIYIYIDEYSYIYMDI